MALTTCRDCGKQISTQAASCPHCGRPQPRKNSRAMGWIKGFFLICFVLWIYAAASSPHTPSTTPAPVPITSQSPQSTPSPVTTPSYQPFPSAAEGRNPLDDFMETTEAKGVKIIDRYYTDDGALYIVLDEDTWNSFDKDHAHRFCEALAQSDFLDTMNLPVAYLMLDNGRTKVGSISYSVFGHHCVFNADSSYWDYK